MMKDDGGFLRILCPALDPARDVGKAFVNADRFCC
jgi:hypothetical protein